MRIFIPIFLVIAALLTFLAISTAAPVDKNATTSYVFVVAQGEGVNAIARRLEAQGLIRSRFGFIFEVRRLGLGKKIQAGDFRLSKSMTPAEIAQSLTTGTLDVWVRIIEGLRAEEIADVLKAKIPTYKNTWVKELKKNEGRLFPDTYLIPKDADIDLVVSILTVNFEKKLKDLHADVGRNGLSREESIILASIVEREVRFAQDRPIVAGILLNRLKIGMALQADATVQYALGFQPQKNTWWKKNLMKEDLTVNSPYNTYKFPGLPPTPIANPGLASIKAAINSTDTDYLYYLSDKEGHMHYARTLEEHNSNIAKYL